MPTDMPPSTKITWPVMKAASSEARKQCTLAISSGPAIRAMGILAIICSLILSGTPTSIAVMVALGALRAHVFYLAFRGPLARHGQGLRAGRLDFLGDLLRARRIGVVDRHQRPFLGEALGRRLTDLT